MTIGLYGYDSGKNESGEVVLPDKYQIDMGNWDGSVCAGRDRHLLSEWPDIVDINVYITVVR